MFGVKAGEVHQVRASLFGPVDVFARVFGVERAADLSAADQIKIIADKTAPDFLKSVVRVAIVRISEIFREDIFPNCSTVILSLQSNKTARYSDGYVTPGLSPRLITLMIFTPFSVSFLFLLPDIFNSFLFCRAGNHSVSFFIKYYCFR